MTYEHRSILLTTIRSNSRPSIQIAPAQGAGQEGKLPPALCLLRHFHSAQWVLSKQARPRDGYQPMAYGVLYSGVKGAMRAVCDVEIVFRAVAQAASLQRHETTKTCVASPLL